MSPRAPSFVAITCFLSAAAACSSKSGDAAPGPVVDAAPEFGPADVITGDADLGELAYSPGATVLGKSYGEWTKAYWQWLLPIAKAQSPYSGGDCTQGQSGPVWFLTPGTNLKPNTRTCTIPSDKAILVPIIHNLCMPCPETDGCTTPIAQAELQKCQTDFFQSADTLQLVLDDKSLGSTTDFALYRVPSGVFSWKAPSSTKDQIVACTGPVGKNDCSIPEGDRSGLSDGYWVILKPLPAGTHTIYLRGSVTGSVSAYEEAVAWDLVVTP